MTTLQNVLDANYAKRQARGYDLKVTLKKNFKGYSLFATKPISRGSVIAYYKFKVHRYTDNFRGKKNNMYAMSVYTKTGRYNPYFIGDVYEGSLDLPKYNIPFWAYFSNEPSGKQIGNCELNTNLKSNYRHRDRVKEGETMVYKLVATRPIQPGEEICWCYGESYMRKYVANCD